MLMNQRSFDRSDAQMRPVTITRAYLKNALGSCLIEFGDTKVICAATVDESLPPWRKASGKGWVTAEYAMLPASTNTRTRREMNGPSGRSHEIQRLIGRSLRTVVDMNLLGETTVHIDCDVIQADGGTRTASITGAWVALYDALEVWRKAGKLKANPIIGQVAAVSVGMVNGRLMLDLDYHEDSHAEVDMNLVMTSAGEFVEIQGTGERTTFDRTRLNTMLDFGTAGINELLVLQRSVLGLESA